MSRVGRGNVASRGKRRGPNGNVTVNPDVLDEWGRSVLLLPVPDNKRSLLGTAHAQASRCAPFNIVLVFPTLRWHPPTIFLSCPKIDSVLVTEQEMDTMQRDLRTSKTWRVRCIWGSSFLLPCVLVFMKSVPAAVYRTAAESYRIDGARRTPGNLG